MSDDSCESFSVPCRQTTQGDPNSIRLHWRYFLPGSITVSRSSRTWPSNLPCWNSQPPLTFPWCLKITAGKDIRRLSFLTSVHTSFHDILMGVSALFCLPPASVGSSLILFYRDSEGDSCTLTAATFPDALLSFSPITSFVSPPPRSTAMSAPLLRVPGPALRPWAAPLPPFARASF